MPTPEASNNPKPELRLVKNGEIEDTSELYDEIVLSVPANGSSEYLENLDPSPEIVSQVVNEPGMVRRGIARALGYEPKTHIHITRKHHARLREV